MFLSPSRTTSFSAGEGELPRVWNLCSLGVLSFSFLSAVLCTRVFCLAALAGAGNDAVVGPGNDALAVAVTGSDTVVDAGNVHVAVVGAGKESVSGAVDASNIPANTKHASLLELTELCV